MSLDRPPIADEFRSAAEYSSSCTATSGKSAPPFSLHLSATERAGLLRQADQPPPWGLIRPCLLDGLENSRRSSRQPVKDEQILAKMLGKLGKSKLANNLNQLAKVASLGSLPVGPETEQAVVEACQEVRHMRETTDSGARAAVLSHDYQGQPTQRRAPVRRPLAQRTR